MLIRTHMEELKDVTSTFLYESYRTAKLSGPDGSAKNEKCALMIKGVLC
jgi:septin family protein